MTRSFEVTVGTSATPLVAPDWVDAIALPATGQTAGFTVTAAMLGKVVPYKSATAGAATIDTGLTPDIGAELLFGQAGAGELALTAGGGVTLTGLPSTLGLGHVIVGTQSAPNVWNFADYSWNLMAIGNPNAQPLLVAYGKITITNLDPTNSVLVDTSPNVAWGGVGIPLGPGGSHTEYYGNAPAELWYASVETGTLLLGVKTGAVTPGG